MMDVDSLKTVHDLKKFNIYIFGMGVRGKRCLDKLKSNNVTIRGFIDNKSDSAQIAGGGGRMLFFG